MQGDRVMGDMYNYGTYSNNININNNACSSSLTTHDHHRSSDDISLFLHQVLLHSPPSTSPSFLTSRGTQTLSLSEPPVTAAKGVIFAVDSFDGADNGVYLLGNASGTAVNVSSSSIGGASDQNETDHECDCESEEGLEALTDALTDEVPAKPAPPRSSKRSRAAEVHNLSEKRRRSRINEKMKALQNLIPNSNKTDKASMLDEAIEYLKQLQLQVQMLSMRNGISLHPICLPGIQQPLQLSHARVGYGEETASQHVNMISSVPLDEETSAQTVFRPPSQCASLNKLSIPNASNIIRSETSFGLESSIPAHFGPFPFRMCSEEICRDDTLPYQHELNANYAERDPLAMATAISFPFRTQASNLRDSISLEACMMGRDQAEGVLLKNLEHNLIIHPDLKSLQTGRSALNAEVKIENPAI